MSFFAELLAGATSGLGKGIVDQADYNDKLEAQQAAKLQQQQFQQMMQQQRLDEAASRQQDRLDAKANSRSSGGGDNIVDRIMSADTPEKRQQALGLVEAFGGVNAAKAVADKVYGAPQMQEVPADYVGLPGQSDIGPDAKRLEKSTYIAEKGAQELQRLYALFANKGDTKGNAQGEEQYMSNDLRAAGLEQALKGGKPLDQASAYASQVGDPATYDKNRTNADRVAVSEKNAQAKVDAAEAKRLADVAKAEARTGAELDKAILSYEKLKKDARPKDRDVYDAVILDLKSRRAAFEPTATAPAKQPSNWTASGTTAPKVQDSLARFSQLRQR